MAKNDHKVFGYASIETEEEKAQPVVSANTLPPWVFAQVVDQLTTAVCITDSAANILYVNRAFTEVTGYTSQEVLGKNTTMLSDQCTTRSSL